MWASWLISQSPMRILPGDHRACCRPQTVHRAVGVPGVLEPRRRAAAGRRTAARRHPDPRPARGGGHDGGAVPALARRHAPRRCDGRPHGQTPDTRRRQRAARGRVRAARPRPRRRTAACGAALRRGVPGRLCRDHGRQRRPGHPAPPSPPGAARARQRQAVRHAVRHQHVHRSARRRGVVRAGGIGGLLHRRGRVRPRGPRGPAAARAPPHGRGPRARSQGPGRRHPGHPHRMGPLLAPRPPAPRRVHLGGDQLLRCRHRRSPRPADHRPVSAPHGELRPLRRRSRRGRDRRLTARRTRRAPHRRRPHHLARRPHPGRRLRRPRSGQQHARRPGRHVRSRSRHRAEPDRGQHPATGGGARRTPRPGHRRLPPDRPGRRPLRGPHRRSARTRPGPARRLPRRRRRTRPRRRPPCLPGHHPRPARRRDDGPAGPPLADGHVRRP